MSGKTIAWSLVLGATFATGLIARPHIDGLDVVADISEDGADKPLYWVAPMDPNYRRDKPGQSPMGMDLIPVYPDDVTNDAEPGLVEINPAVINQLGVKTASVERSALAPQIDTVGYVGYDENSLAHINTRVEGWIEKLNVEAAGDPVKKGQVLFELYSPTLVNAQEEYLAALASGNAALQRASQSRLSALGLGNAEISRLKKERTVRQRVRVRAPQDGIVTELGVRRGAFIKPSTTVMSLAALDQVWVEAEIFERQSAWLHAGQHAMMSLDYMPGREWHGRVDYIYPSLDARTRTLRVRLSFENTDGVLRPNMFARVRVMADGVADALNVPAEAVIRGARQSRVVLAMGEGRFKSIPVDTGLEAAGRIEILRGLSEGQSIVTSAQFLLDSESSKTADFSRMEFVDEAIAEAPADTLWVAGELLSVDESQGLIKLQHDAIPEWDWMPMSMNFAIGEGLDVSALPAAAKGRYQLRKIDGGMPQVLGFEAAISDVLWVSGELLEVDAGNGRVKLQHAAIPEWDWMPMSMNFVIGEGFEAEALPVGSAGEFQLRKVDGGMPQVLGYKKAGEGDAHAGHQMPSDDAVDHSGHDMSHSHGEGQS